MLETLVYELPKKTCKCLLFLKKQISRYYSTFKYNSRSDLERCSMLVTVVFIVAFKQILIKLYR